MLELHLYGKLRAYATGYQPPNGSVMKLKPHPDETIASLLERVGIPVDEINHLFFNSKLLASRTRMASFMGLPQSNSDLADWDLNICVDDGDRIGLFGRDMALLGM